MATHPQDLAGIRALASVTDASDSAPAPAPVPVPVPVSVLVDYPDTEFALVDGKETLEDALPVLQPLEDGRTSKFIILLVEDGEGEMTLIQRAIERANVRCELICFANGELALDYIAKRGDYVGRSEERTPDLVLLDLHVPGLGGKEILRAIRSDDRTAGIPTVMFSGSRDEHEITQLYRLGVNAYVVKPDCLDNYCDVVSELERFWFRTATLPEKGK